LGDSLNSDPDYPPIIVVGGPPFKTKTGEKNYQIDLLLFFFLAFLFVVFLCIYMYVCMYVCIAFSLPPQVGE